MLPIADARPAPVNPKPFKARYFPPRKVERTERDAKYAGEDVEPGRYEVHPHGSFRHARIYRRTLPRGSRGTPQLRRVKHVPTIDAVIAKVGAPDG